MVNITKQLKFEHLIELQGSLMSQDIGHLHVSTDLILKNDQ